MAYVSPTAAYLKGIGAKTGSSPSNVIRMEQSSSPVSQQQAYINGLNLGVPKQTGSAGSTGGSSGGSGSSGGGRGGRSGSASVSASYGAGGFDASSVWQSYLDSLKAQAQAAYDRNMARIADSYNQGASMLNQNLASTMNQLGIARDASNKNITRDAESSLRAAYINNMLSKRDMRQNMSAQGLNGGAAESTMASMSNNYGTSRNNIETTRNRNLEDLEREYNSNVAQAQQAFNSAMADLYARRMAMEMEAENALTNFQSGYASNFSSLATENGDYLNALRGALTNQQGWQLDPSQATNIYTGINMQQAAPIDAGSNYAQYLAQQALQAQNNQATQNQLLAAGLTPQQIAQYFASFAA